jgi:hypothetical protein
VDGGEVRLLVPGPGEAPAAVPLVVGGSRIAVREDGSVAIDGAAVPGVAALPDARIALDEHGRAVLPTGPTERYPHGVVGDLVEAAAVSVVDTATGAATVLAEVGADEVIEGTGVIWADADGDGSRDAVVTVSTPPAGARLAVFGDGGLVAESDPIGRSNRWRHQVAVAPTAPDGGLEIVAVRTPHIGGVVEFFRLEEGRLDRTAGLSGFTSHVIGSRNLAIPVVADADGDGALEVVLPSQDRRSLGGVARTADGATVAWLVPLEGTLSANLGAVPLPDGGLALAAGRADGVVRIWMP